MSVNADTVFVYRVVCSGHRRFHISYILVVIQYLTYHPSLLKVTNSYVPELTSKQVSDENNVLVNDLYRLIKKYQAIRNIVRTLVVRLFTYVE